MKKILIVSATLKSNYLLSKDIKRMLDRFDNIDSSIALLETLKLPLYTEDVHKKEKENYIEQIVNLTNNFINASGIIVCSPEYNGSIPPILSNAIAWISTSTDNWRDAFNNKVALIASSSGGPSNKFSLSMRIQLEHLGVIVFPRTINITTSNPLNFDSSKKILKHYIDLI